MLLAACTASSDSHAGPGTLAVASNAATAAQPQPTNDGHDDRAADQGVDEDDGLVELDPVAHIRGQMARQPARCGSGVPVQACTLGGKVTIAGHTVDIRDGMQSNGNYSVAEYQQACDGMANGLNQTGNAPATIHYSTHCPGPAQGSCRDVMHSGMDACYYQRTELQPLPDSCANAGGRWQAGSRPPACNHGPGAGIQRHGRCCLRPCLHS